MGGTVIYTAIFGNIGDQLKPPRNVPPDIPCEAFIDIDRPEDRNGWRCRPPVWNNNNPRLRARRHKVLSHILYPEAEYSLWLDGCFTPLVSPQGLIDEFLADHDICLFKHMQRNCVYQELEACVRLKKDRPEIMRRQVDDYRREGYPHNNGLVETGALLRRHTKAVKDFNEAWWQELRHKSLRDQLSFNYVAWKLGIEYNVFPQNRVACPYFHWTPHR